MSNAPDSPSGEVKLTLVSTENASVSEDVPKVEMFSTEGEYYKGGGGGGSGMNERIAKLESDVGYIKSDVNNIKKWGGGAIITLFTCISGLYFYVDTSIDQLGDKIYGKFDKADNKLLGLSERTGANEKAIIKLDAKVEKLALDTSYQFKLVNQKIENIDNKIDGMDKKIDLLINKTRKGGP